MAEILKTFSFKLRNALYPWDEWLDGKIRRLVLGRDVRCSTVAFRSAASLAARKRGLTAHVANEGDKSLVLQATPRNGVNGNGHRKRR